ncbi:TatD family hydrolase [Marinobacter salicampi]|uniref:TatD family hydrolase n=1 Tax=Marinobacter salicampi TaxID=435907 RepID=UPI0014093BE0|nr:TatD family hydrolase [Marinobacter salicampi]
MNLVDAHCHFDFPAFDNERDSIMAALAKAGVDRMVIPGVRQADWGQVASTAASHEGLYYCLGIHPWFIDEHERPALDYLAQELRAAPRNCVGLGECGLDRLRGSLDKQQWWFEAQVELARDLDLPLVIHSVRTNDEVFDTLKKKRFQGPALVHAFAGSEQQARKLTEFGIFLGVSGIITYDRARKTTEAIASAPLSSLILETDAPDMPPAGVEKGRNSPTRLPEILSALVKLRPESEDVIRHALRDNVYRLYRWRESVDKP